MIDTQLEALVDALVQDAELIDDSGFLSLPNIRDHIMTELDKMSAPTSRQWILKPAAQDGRKHACCRKAVDAWQVIAKTRDSLSNWVGTFTYEDSVQGRILSFDHSDISKIINDIRRNHSESFLSSKTGLTYKPSLSNIRLVCNHGRDANVAEFRERKTRRQLANTEDDGCPCCLNLVWIQARPSVYAWRVGTINTSHQNHIARVQRSAAHDRAAASFRRRNG